MTLKVHSYESMGTYDGPGLRLVVFLQGCPFRCLYCANPDTIPFEGGTETDIDEILQMAVRQKPFFGKRGGVTFSGGEPTVQAKALVPLVRQLHENGINVLSCLMSRNSTPQDIRHLQAAAMNRHSVLPHGWRNTANLSGSGMSSFRDTATSRRT